MIKLLAAAAAVAASVAVAAPAHAEHEKFPLTCEGEAGFLIDTAGSDTGYGAACYSDEGFHENCLVFKEVRYDPPQNGVTRERTCIVPIG